VHERLLVQHGVLRQHPVEIGAKPVGQVFGVDRPAKPARMKAAGDPVTNLDPHHSFADRCDLAGAVGFVQTFNFAYWGYGSAIAVLLVAGVFILSLLISRAGRGMALDD
jgi:hypothetical protein